MMIYFLFSKKLAKILFVCLFGYLHVTPKWLFNPKFFNPKMSQFYDDYEDPFDPTLPIPLDLKFFAKDESTAPIKSDALSHLPQNDYSLPIVSDADQIAKESKQVCRHFLLGQCYRSDCWFSHDPEMLICKFYLRGICYKGSGCEFSHGEGLSQASTESLNHSGNIEQEITAIQSLSLDSSDDFPTLSKPNKPQLFKSISKKSMTPKVPKKFYGTRNPTDNESNKVE
jgi:hypothetical protein